METHTELPHKNTLLTDLERVDAGEIEETEVHSQNGITHPRMKNLLTLQVMAPGQYDLDSTVEVWSDFLCTHLHPRSLLMLPGYFHNE